MFIEPRLTEDASTPEARRRLHEGNRLSWNEATKAHNSHKADQAKFLREGGNKLFPEETALPGRRGTNSLPPRPTRTPVGGKPAFVIYRPRFV
jgi:hypothetical protein